MGKEKGLKKGLKNRRTINNAVATNLHEQFEEIHSETRIPKSNLLDISLILLNDLYEREGSQGLIAILKTNEQKDPNSE